MKNGGIAEHFSIKLMEKGFCGKINIKAIESFIKQATVESALRKNGLTVDEMYKFIRGVLIDE